VRFWTHILCKIAEEACLLSYYVLLADAQLKYSGDSRWTFPSLNYTQASWLFLREGWLLPLHRTDVRALPLPPPLLQAFPELDLTVVYIDTCRS
jgi:hypothetical protein